MNIKSQYRVIVLALITFVTVVATGCKKETHYTAEEEAAVSGIVTPSEPTDRPSVLSRLGNMVGIEPAVAHPECGGAVPTHPIAPPEYWVKDLPTDVRFPDEDMRFIHRPPPDIEGFPQDFQEDVDWWATYVDMMPCEYRLYGYFPDRRRYDFHEARWENRDLNLEPDQSKLSNIVLYIPVMLNTDVYYGTEHFLCQSGQNMRCERMVAGNKDTLESYPDYSFTNRHSATYDVGRVTYRMSQWLQQNCKFTGGSPYGIGHLSSVKCP